MLDATKSNIHVYRYILCQYFEVHLIVTRFYFVQIQQTMHACTDILSPMIYDIVYVQILGIVIVPLKDIQLHTLE